MLLPTWHHFGEVVGLWDLEGTADNVNVGAEDGSMVMEGNTDKEGVKEGVDMDNKDDSPERMNEGVNVLMGVTRTIPHK